MLRLTLRVLSVALAALAVIVEGRATAAEREGTTPDAEPNPVEPGPPARPHFVDLALARETEDGCDSVSWSHPCDSQTEADRVRAGWLFGGTGGEC